MDREDSDFDRIITDYMGDKHGYNIGYKVIRDFESGEVTTETPIREQVHKIHSFTKESFLHYAAAIHNAEIIEFLIGKGLDVNHQDTYGMTPLHKVLKDNLAKVLSKLMVPNNLEVKQTSDQLRQLLQTVELLVDNGGNPNIKDEKGNTPLHF
jgi:ankyrin repeat protein